MLKGINIGTDTTVKDILDILEGVDPTEIGRAHV